MRTQTVSAGFIALALFLVGCGEAESPGPAEPTGTVSQDESSVEGLAAWELSNPDSIRPEDDNLEIGVSRLGCANGETGEIIDIDVDPGEDRVVIEATVEAREGAADCPANEVVPIDVELGDPIGDRELVDGVCEHERAAETTLCDTSVRWSEEAS